MAAADLTGDAATADCYITSSKKGGCPLPMLDFPANVRLFLKEAFGFLFLFLRNALSNVAKIASVVDFFSP